jgi:putative ABC transport system ATP-binding protein
MIQAKGLTKTYHLDSTLVQALNGVDIEVQTGEFLAIAGPSGSGKSTLLNLIGCIEKPTQGNIIFDGQDVTTLGADQLADLRARRLGFVFQTFNLLPVLTAYENVEFPLLLNKVPAADRKKRVRELLDEVGLGDHAKHRPAQLSGGQRQRVAVARALAMQPALILADEPTANLDQTTGLEILDLMHELNRKTKVTLVFSTHDPKIMNRADRVIHLQAGRIVSE